MNDALKKIDSSNDNTQEKIEQAVKQAQHDCESNTTSSSFLRMKRLREFSNSVVYNLTGLVSAEFIDCLYEWINFCSDGYEQLSVLFSWCVEGPRIVSASGRDRNGPVKEPCR